MTLSVANINSLWGSLLVEELVRHGIDYFCIAPGSRSTPLVVAIAQHPRASTHVHVDERGLAYRAIGYARATGKPATIVCTSGTAVANFFPAIVEAWSEALPLVVLTADRPPELRNKGANQTIDQVKIFGSYVGYFADLPCPDPGIPADQLLTTIDEAVYHATTAPRGPVHLNCMFREPLEPSISGEDFSSYLAPLANWKKGQSPFKGMEVCREETDSDATPVSELITKASRGVLVVGKLTNRVDQAAVAKLAQLLQWPVLADIQSGLSMSGYHQIFRYHDLALTSPLFTTGWRPDVVLQLGDRITSKRLLQFIAAVKPAEHLLVVDHNRPHNPTDTVTRTIQMPVAEFCRRIPKSVKSSTANRLLEQSQQISSTIEGAIDQALSTQHQLTEALVVSTLLGELPPSHALFLASSMPIRLADMFGANLGRLVSVGANRGASGIDGTVASAVGYAEGLGSPVVLIIGDLALFHDLNSLAMVRKTRTDITIVVLNNNGGGIFEHLPIGAYPDLCEEYFVAPQNLNFKEAAAMFDLPYNGVTDLNHLRTVFEFNSRSEKSSLLEIQISRAHNLAFHHELLAAIRMKIDLAGVFT